MTDPDPEATFTHRVDQYRAMLQRTVYAFAGPLDAGDLRQGLLLALWKALPAFREECRESTFVYGVHQPSVGERADQ